MAELRTITASRQMIMTGPTTWIISQISSESNIVVMVKANVTLVENPSRLPLRAETRGRRLCEVNISDRRRRAVFTLSLGSAEGTKSPHRIKLTTKATRKGDEESINFLLQDLKYSDDDVPMTVDEKAFTPNAFGKLGSSQFENCRRNYLPKLAKIRGVAAKRIDITASQDGWWIDDAKDGTTLAASDHRGPETNFGLLGEDLVNIIDVVGNMHLTAPVEYAIDRQGLVKLSVQTKLASYDIYVPTLQRQSNTRCSRGLIRMGMPATPQGAAVGSGATSHAGTTALEA